MRPQIKFVPASSLAHLKLAKRLHQTRGVTVFHAVLTRLDDVRDYEESERIAARVAAAMTAYIKRGPDYQPIDVASTTQGERAFEMAPGMIWDSLAPGEDVGVISSDRPNSSLEAFRAAMLRAAAAGTGTRFSAIARDYRGTYSSQRQELVEGAQHYRRLFDYLTRTFYLPVWRNFVDAAVLAGRISLPTDLDPASVYRPELRQPALPWIDPKKEIEAQALAVQSGFRARWQVIRDLGGDPQAVDKQLASDPLDVRPAEPETGNAPQPEPEPGETEQEEADSDAA
jgi:lambda family phage portal protein